MSVKSWQPVKKGLRIVAAVLGGLGVVVVAWFMLRQSLLGYSWQKAVESAQHRGYQLSHRGLRFKGLMTVQVRGLSLQYQGQSVLSVHSLQARPDVLRLIIGDLRLQSLHMNGLRLVLLQTSGSCNICPLFNSSDERNSVKRAEAVPVNQRIYDAATRLLDLLPPDFKLTRSLATYQNDTLFSAVGIPALSYQNEILKGKINVRENDQRGAIALRGQLDRSSITGRLHLTPLGAPVFWVPWVERKWGLRLGLGKSSLNIKKFVMDDGILQWDAKGLALGLTLEHERLSNQAVQFPLLQGRFRGQAGSDFVEVDSATVFRMGRLPVRVYALVDRGQEARWDLRLTTAWSASTDFLASLPRGIFEHTAGMQGTGQLRFRFSLQLEDRAPQQCRLNSALDQKDFQITRMGRTDLRRMNGPFQHTVVRNGQPQRTLMVGPANPFFTPLDRIPMAMQQAVMTGEDGDFYSHRGFYPEAFRLSLAQNYRQGKFARGGSTITMQLVKNVFLHPRKTIARKSEEFLLTWLIENQRLTSKARMMEVYLNVIEFGDNVWGIGEAARHYFDRSPSELDPIQCVFLAGLVPRPRVLQNLLEPDGKVSPRNGFFTAIRNRFYRRGWLPLEDSALRDVGLRPSVYRHLTVPDSTLLLQPLDWDEEDSL
ncbi:MAG: transglycosylase domain-containing protein [Bacteroidia bacterium]